MELTVSFPSSHRSFTKKSISIRKVFTRMSKEFMYVLSKSYAEDLFCYYKNIIM